MLLQRSGSPCNLLRLLVVFLVIGCFLGATPESALAAKPGKNSKKSNNGGKKKSGKKNKKGKKKGKKKEPKAPAYIIVQPNEVFDVEVTIELGGKGGSKGKNDGKKNPGKKKKSGKKKKPKKKSAASLTNVALPVKAKEVKSVVIQCYGQVPGTTEALEEGLAFTSFEQQLKRVKKGAKQANELAALRNAGSKACNKPDFLSLEQYKGEFGAAEAHILFNRFGFGARPDQISGAVAAGLNTAVDQLMTVTVEPGIEGIEKELQCDGRMPGDKDKETCDQFDKNDVYFPGVRYGVYHSFIYSQNQYVNKMFLFLHDERMAASSSILNGDERHALLSHLSLLRRGATSGDYVQFMREWNDDHLGHIRWLDGDSNKGTSPNENYAREFWELGTVGPTGQDGQAVYGDLDIAQSALAFSGWTTVVDNEEGPEGKEYRVRYTAFSSGLHAPGAKTIFQGTPYQATVYNAEDVLRATFAHPRTAEHLAEDLWKEFINPFPTTQAIESLAELIRENNYNLHPVMKRIMTSRAVYAPRSRNSLVKHPVDLLIGFLRATKWPVKYGTLDSYLEKLGERPLQPPTVFGWDEQRLAGEAFVLEWRNVLLQLLNRGDSLKEDEGYDIHQELLAGQPSSLEVIDRFAALLGITLSADQKAVLDQYLNYNRIECKSYHVNQYGCTLGEYFLDRDLFDSHPQGDGQYKTQGLLMIMAMLPSYRVK